MPTSQECGWSVIFRVPMPSPAQIAVEITSPYPMTNVDPKSLEDFAASGRSGRRNALADILDSNVSSTSTASLPLDLQKLSCSDTSEMKKADIATGGEDTTANSSTDESNSKS